MLDRLTTRSTSANVVATIALVMAVFVAGGGAYAAATIEASDIKKNAILARHIKNNQVLTRHINHNQVTGADVNEAKLDATPLRTRAAQGGCQATVAGTGVMVKVGPVCIDRYEASVWSKPTGGVQYGVSSDDYPCDDDGHDCQGVIFARSVPGVTPSRYITWFQAQQALANSGKRLPTNAEWQMAVAGTLDSTVCNVSLGYVANTGANAGCLSAWGANDMVGNLWEWVADWVPASTSCSDWGTFSDDYMCLSGASTADPAPGALIRGGDSMAIEFTAGAFAVYGVWPQDSGPSGGFRGAR